MIIIASTVYFPLALQKLLSKLCSVQMQRVFLGRTLGRKNWRAGVLLYMRSESIDNNNVFKGFLFFFTFNRYFNFSRLYCTQYDRLLAWYCRLSVRPFVTLCIVSNPYILQQKTVWTSESVVPLRTLFYNPQRSQTTPLYYRVSYVYGRVYYIYSTALCIASYADTLQKWWKEERKEEKEWTKKNVKTRYATPELGMGQVHPWVGSGRVG